MTMDACLRDAFFLLLCLSASQLQESRAQPAAGKKGANILIVNQLPHSSWLMLRATGRALAARGHSVTVLMPDDVLNHLSSASAGDGLQYAGVPCAPGTLAAARAYEQRSWQGGYQSVIEAMQRMLHETSKSCEDLLRHLPRVTTEDAQFDLVLSSIPEFPCGPVLARYLGIPSAIVFIPTNTVLLDSATPLPLVYYPIIPSGFTTQMTFLQKVQNVIYYLISYYYYKQFHFAFDPIVHKYISNDTSTGEIMADTDLWLALADFNVEFARPTMPNVVHLPAVNLAEPKPLPQDLEAFVQSSGEAGVILFCLGTIVARMPDTIEQVFLDAFAQLPQKVIWKLAPDSVPDTARFPHNVRPMRWVPQVDLLAHKKVRLFINHGGTNGVYESVRHGVPMVMVTLPLASELRDNMARARHHGYGVQIDIVTMTTDELVQAIRHVLSTKSYQEKVERASRLMADQPTPPLNLTMWWIEHVIRHGGLPHLRTRANTIPFYQYFLLDVMALLVATAAVVLGGLACVCRLGYRAIKGQQELKEKKNC